MTSEKLFFVSVTYSGWVLAEDKYSAERLATDISDTEDTYEVTAERFSEGALITSGWDRECLVYHENQRNFDLTLGEAISQITQLKEPV